MRYDLVPSSRSVKVSSLASGRAADEEVKNWEGDEGSRESEESLISNRELCRRDNELDSDDGDTDVREVRPSSVP